MKILHVGRIRKQGLDDPDKFPSPVIGILAMFMAMEEAGRCMLSQRNGPEKNQGRYFSKKTFKNPTLRLSHTVTLW